MRNAQFVPAQPPPRASSADRRRHLLRNGGLATLGAALLLLSFSAGPAGHKLPTLHLGAGAKPVYAPLPVTPSKLADRAGENARTLRPPARYDAAASALLFGGPAMAPSREGVLISAAIVPGEFEPSRLAPPIQTASLAPADMPSTEFEAPAPPDITPLPPERPAHLQAAGRSIAMRSPANGAAAAVRTAMRATPPEEPGFFQRIFGAPAQPAPPQLMAYAPASIETDTPRAIPRSSPAEIAPRQEKTAFYVIEDRIVYMPDGSRLEAHSGLGPKKDDPRFVHVRMNGATPPNVYNLTMRERLFHGVEAIRMLPQQPHKMFGRDGILAHSYLLGPNGDSHGCVSFKDYNKFLNAFKRGEVTRIVVVSNNSSMLAMNTRR